MRTLMALIIMLSAMPVLAASVSRCQVALYSHTFSKHIRTTFVVDIANKEMLDSLGSFLEERMNLNCRSGNLPAAERDPLLNMDRVWQRECNRFPQESRSKCISALTSYKALLPVLIDVYDTGSLEGSMKELKQAPDCAANINASEQSDKLELVQPPTDSRNKPLVAPQ